MNGYTSNGGYAVFGQDLDSGTGVYGQGGGTGGGNGQPQAVGVFGTSPVVGVEGVATSGGGTAVFGYTTQSTAIAVEGVNRYGGVGVVGLSNGATSNAGTNGVYGATVSGDSIFGDASGQTTGNHAGVKGQSASSSGYGVVGVNSTSGVGVLGLAGGTTYGSAAGQYGVYGDGGSSGTGVYGTSSGVANAIWGVAKYTGNSTPANGVEGDTYSPALSRSLACRLTRSTSYFVGSIFASSAEHDC